jgi:predicted ATP-grasp superfamily ATP-dependent carboligase
MPKTDGAVLVEGFPRSGSIGGQISTGTASFIVQQLNLPLIGDIVSAFFPSVALVRQGNPLSGIRLFGNERVILVVSDFDLKDPGTESNVVSAILDFA